MIVLHLPPPISVNKMRKVNWKAQKRYSNWQHHADQLLLEHGGRNAQGTIHGPYAVVLTIDPTMTKCDLDNTIKAAIDWIVRLEFVDGDGPKHLRELTVGWGPTKHGSTISIIEAPDGTP